MSSAMAALFFALVALTVNLTNGSRILGIFIHPGQSHFESFHPILNGLAIKGHDVTVFSYFGNSSSHPNYKEILIDGAPDGFSKIKVGINELDKPSRSLYYQTLEFINLKQWAVPICEFALQSKALDKILDLHKAKPFDLIAMEMFNTDCMMGTIHKMAIPFVSISSCALMPWHYDRIGLPDIPSYLGSEFSGFSHKMTFSERMNNWISINAFKRLYRLRQLEDNELIRQKYGEGLPDVQEIAQNVSLMLVNHHFSFGGPRPLVPQVIEIGGVHIKDDDGSKALPANIQTILDSAKAGAVVISWGSMVQGSSLDSDRLQGVLRAFSRLKQTIIWKWETDSLPNKPDNVYTFKWLPQKDILCHPNVKVFWSHGGNLGTTEGVHCGVPMIITPFYGDQFFSGNAVINRQIGTILNYEDISEESVFAAISKVLEPSYRENAAKVSFAFRNRPLSPVDTSVWWIEYVIATGGMSFARTPYVVDMYWFTYHSVDVVVVLIAGFFIMAAIFSSLIVYCCNQRKNKPRKEQKLVKKEKKIKKK